MKKFIIFIFIFISFNSFSQNESENKTVMVKAIETYGSFASMQKNLHIIDEKGELTTIELEKHNTKGISENMATLKKVLDEYLTNSYKIISSTAVSFGWNGVFTIEHTYLLQLTKNP